MVKQKHGKKYRAAATKVDQAKVYELDEAVGVLQGLKLAKFDETIEFVAKLNIDPKKAEQRIRGAFSLPNGLGKAKKVIVFAEGKEAEDAKAAGAIETGTTDLAEKIKNGWMDFDVVIATKNTMRFVQPLGKTLGPSGKMPNVKTGTVTENVITAVKDFTAGKLEFKTDDFGNIAVPVGKKSFEKKALIENIEAFYEHIRGLKPATVKGVFIQKTSVSSTMGPGLRVAFATV
ncbi:MAG: 50S ribosomal protein L1 [Planctomycetes bacterium]|nr:50S ribosomal protein L1 [Planctomycetota bacterium]